MENRLPHRGTRQYKRQNEVTLEMLVVADNPVVGMPSPHGSVDGNTIAQESAMISSFNAGGHADQGGLASPVLSSQRGDLAALKTYRNILERLCRPVSLGQLAHFERGLTPAGFGVIHSNATSVTS
jgi:hypothetical protein